jgi:capsular exopolysaccharide synthesis family protein
MLGSEEQLERLKTEIPNLSVLPAGPIPPNPAELLHSERFKAFLAQVAGNFDRVVIDSPPLIAVTDGTILSTLVDSTVLVVKAFATTKEVCRQAMRALIDVGSSTAGAILNYVDLDRHEYKYYHYYYRRYGNYYAETTPQAGALPPSDRSARPEPPVAH